MDARFSRLRTDPRFKRPQKDKHRVVVDERFRSIFEDSVRARKGKGKAKTAETHVDKYGRRVSSKKQQEDLQKFYKLDEGDDKTTPGPSKSWIGPDYARGEGLDESSGDEDAQSDADSVDDTTPVILGHGSVDPRRRKIKPGLLDGELEVNLDETEFAELDAQAAAFATSSSGFGFGDQKRTTAKGHETSRLAVVNLDWDHVKADHLYKAFSSTAALIDIPSEEREPKKLRRAKSFSGKKRILSVRIYPSEFGKSRMRKEDLEGPPSEIFGSTKGKQSKSSLAASLLRSKGQAFDRGDDEELNIEDINEKTIFVQDDIDQLDQDALRKYQLERLRYFYAVVECDSSETAAFLYQELDATELERTANVFDLSFVPDDLAFDEPYRDETTQDLANLKPLDFATDALQSSKVKLTWDEDDQDRVEITRRPVGKQEIVDNDFKAYLAVTDEEESEASATENGPANPKSSTRDRLRALLLGGGDADGQEDPFFEMDKDAWGDSKRGKAGDLEITFSSGLTGTKADDGSDEELTTLDRYKRKMKDKKQARISKWDQRKEELKLTQKGPSQAMTGEDDFFDRSEDKEVTGDIPPESTKATMEELDLLAVVGGGDDEIQHFDMAKVLKAEKGSKKKKLKYSKHRAGEEFDKDEAGGGFEIDVNDDRFKVLHEQHDFAIDPSNPHFKKTKAMDKLLDERRNRFKQKEEVENAQRRPAPGDDSGNLQKLIQRVKRTAPDTDGPRLEGGKKRKNVI